MKNAESVLLSEHELKKLNSPLELVFIDIFIRPITLLLTEKGLKKVLFCKVGQLSELLSSFNLNHSTTNAASHYAGIQILEYFEGKRFTFDLLPDIHSTPFQNSVWNVLSSIPYGLTLSYKQVAEMAGSPRACRAAGSSCGANPLPIVIPCHRVLASDGGLGGYGGGLEIKKALLDHEKRYMPNNAFSLKV